METRGLGETGETVEKQARIYYRKADSSVTLGTSLCQNSIFGPSPASCWPGCYASACFSSSSSLSGSDTTMSTRHLGMELCSHMTRISFS